MVLPPIVRQAQDEATPAQPSWPYETDLRVIPGTTRIALTGQQPTVRMVIGEAIENIRVSLLFVDAFPDTARTLEFIRDGLFTAAAKQGPAAAAILKRLQQDETYLSTISPLVSTISLQITYLTSFKATRPHLNFPGQSQRMLRRYHFGSIPSYVFTDGGGQIHATSTFKLQLYISEGVKGEQRVVDNELLQQRTVLECHTWHACHAIASVSQRSNYQCHPRVVLHRRPHIICISLQLSISQM